MVNEWKKRWNSHKGHETVILYFLGYLLKKMIEGNWAKIQENWAYLIIPWQIHRWKQCTGEVEIASWTDIYWWTLDIVTLTWIGQKWEHHTLSRLLYPANIHVLEQSGWTSGLGFRAFRVAILSQSIHTGMYLHLRYCHSRWNGYFSFEPLLFFTYSNGEVAIFQELMYRWNLKFNSAGYSVLKNLRL